MATSIALLCVTVLLLISCPIIHADDAPEEEFTVKLDHPFSDALALFEGSNVMAKENQQGFQLSNLFRESISLAKTSRNVLVQMTEWLKERGGPARNTTLAQAVLEAFQQEIKPAETPAFEDIFERRGTVIEIINRIRRGLQLLERTSEAAIEDMKDLAIAPVNTAFHIRARVAAHIRLARVFINAIKDYVIVKARGKGE